MALDERRLAKLERIHARGGFSYVIRYGVIGWGVGSAVLSAIAMALVSDRREFLLTAGVNLIVFPVGGIFWGATMWWFLENQWKRQRRARNDELSQQGAAAHAPGADIGAPSEARTEIERHELLYAERRALESGHVVDALESLRNRHGVVFFALLAVCIVQVALIASDLAGDGSAGSSHVSWHLVLTLVGCAAIAVHVHTTLRRCTRALETHRRDEDARRTSG